MLVLAYVWIPFVALPIFVSLDNLDPQPAGGGGRPRRQPVAGVLADHASGSASRG